MTYYLGIEILMTTVDNKVKFVVIEERITFEDEKGMSWESIPETIQHNFDRGNSFPTIEEAKAYIEKQKATKH